MSRDDPQRLRDLVRYQRGELLREGLITKEEHADLLSNTPGAVKRLEGYDAMKARAEAAEAQCAAMRQALEGTIDAGAALLAERDWLREALRKVLASRWDIGMHDSGDGVTHRFDGDGAATGCSWCAAKAEARAALGQR